MERVKVQNSNKNYKAKKIFPSISFPIRWLSLLSVNSLMLFNVSFPLLILPSIVNGGEVIAQTDKITQAERLLEQGFELLRQGTGKSVRAGVAKWEEALLLFRETRNLNGQSSILNNIGVVYEGLGEKQKALDYYQQALPILQQIDNRHGQATTLNNIGVIYSELGEAQKALNYHQQALPILQQLEKRGGEAYTLTKIGLIYDSLGERLKALDYYQQALPIFQQIENKGWEALSLSNIAAVYSDLGEKPKALKYYQQALSLSEEVQDRSVKLATLTGIGIVYSHLGEKQIALNFYQKALSLSQEVNDTRGEANILRSIGVVYTQLGEKPKALNYFEQALSLSEEIDDLAGEALALSNIGTVYNDLGEKQKALNYYYQALSLSQEVNDTRGEATTLHNIGIVYTELGETEKALNYFQQTLRIDRQLSDARGEGATLHNIGTVYIRLGETQEALNYFEQALSLRRQVGDRNGKASTLHNIGTIHYKLKEREEALNHFEQALTLRRQVGNRLGEALSLHNIGLVYSDLGETEKALNYYHQALTLSQKVGDQGGEALNFYNIAVLKYRQRNLTESLTFIKKSIEIIEVLRTKVVDQELRISYFATVQDYYQFYIDILMELHKQNPDQGFDAQALQANERRRARSLLELLTEANANIREGVNQNLLNQEETILQKFDATEKRRLELVRSDYKPEQLEKIKQELAALQTEYQQLQTQIKQTSPSYAALKYPEPLNFKQIKQQVLDDNTILLEYSLGKERSYLWAVTKNSITSYELPSQAEIETAAQQFIDMLTAPDLRSSLEDLPNAAQALSEIILKPVASQLENQQLLIVSDSILQYIPFAALSVPGKNTLLLANSKIVNAPSASTIAINRNQTANRQTAGKTVAILADPVFTADDERVTGKAQSNNSSETVDSLRDQRMTRAARYGSANWERLEGTRKEAEVIVAQVSDPQQRTYALDFAANKEKATNPELNEYQFVHFATHGFFNGTQPELSGIVMSLVDKNGNQQNGFLYLQDVFNLKLSAELVVLSACETGLGEEVKGEGIVGLTRGFMYAGSPRVVVSLWKVDDEATAELMTLFYQKMLVEKMKPVEALRGAQMEMLNSEKWSDPQYWAAFTLQGEWQ